MSDIEKYLSATQKYMILLLSANDFEPVKGKTWLQKELFLITNNIPELEETDFEEDFYGPYSEVVDTELEGLQIEGIVDTEKIRLTRFGKDVAKKISPKVRKENLEMISEFKSFLNDLTEDELLGFIYFSYPEMRTYSVKFQEIEEKRLRIAESLYRKKKIGLGKASSIAGISQEELIKKVRASGIKVYSK